MSYWIKNGSTSRGKNAPPGFSGVVSGYRYYSTELGRWINRDPMEESFALNLYSFMNNFVVSRIDVLGLQAMPVPVEPPIYVLPCKTVCKIIKFPVTAPLPNPVAGACTLNPISLIAAIVCCPTSCGDSSLPDWPIPQPQPNPGDKDKSCPKKCPSNSHRCKPYTWSNPTKCGVAGWPYFKLQPGKPATACGSLGGKHYNVKNKKGKHLGSIICCNCCDNTPQGPKYGYGCKIAKQLY